MPGIVDLEVMNTNKGVMIIHAHAGEDQRHCVGWVRQPTGAWRQRHLQGYGKVCLTCIRRMPEEKELEALYRERIKGGTGKLLFVEVKY